MGIGSSLGDREAHLRNAINALRYGTDCKIIALSSIYESPHMGLTPGDSERYPAHLNCVVHIETTLNPLSLLALIHCIEEQGGRIRTEHWGPRTIDVDILVYRDVVIAAKDLELPHPGIEKRAFVAVPLAEIAGDLVLTSGKTVAEIANSEQIREQSLAQVGSYELLL